MARITRRMRMLLVLATVWATTTWYYRSVHKPGLDAHTAKVSAKTAQMEKLLKELNSDVEDMHIDPAEKARCGYHWQRHQILINEMALKTGGVGVVIAERACNSDGTCARNGMSHWLEQMMSAFRQAVVEEKAFFVDWPKYELRDVVHMPHINWTHPGGDLCKKNKCETHRYSGWTRNDVAPTRCLPFPGKEEGGKKNLPPWTHEFGCFANFLMQPGDEIKQRFGNVLNTVTSTNTVSIGVHIRTGDNSFKVLEDKKNSNFGIGYDSHGIKMSTLLEVMQKDALGCAEALQRTINTGGKKVVWLVMSDSSVLRNAVRKEYTGKPGHTVIVNQVEPVHTAKVATPKNVLLDAFGEWWLLGSCDYIVASMVRQEDISGFAATAAARNFDWDNTFYARRYKVNTISGGKSSLKPRDPKCDNPKALRHFRKC